MFYLKSWIVQDALTKDVLFEVMSKKELKKELKQLPKTLLIHVWKKDRSVSKFRFVGGGYVKEIKKIKLK